MLLSLMGLSVPKAMTDVGDVRKGSSEESSAPESWEMVNLEESMKKLFPSSQVSSSMVPLEVSVASESDSVVTGLLAPRSDPLEAAKCIDQVDSFLREALQNPRDRLTILRLEQDVERFIRNPGVQVLEFQPMPSSYFRLAAHRVAQHYYLQSMVVDGGSAEGTRIVARKTGETRFPSLRLGDIPIGPNVGEQEENKAVLVQVVPAKVAIKQRPTKVGFNNGLGPCANGGKLNISKSVEERKEEYNKARARIFCSDSGEKVAGTGSESERDFLVLGSISDAPRRQESVKDEIVLKERDLVPKGVSIFPHRNCLHPPNDSEGIEPKEERDTDPFVKRKLVSSNSVGSSVGNGGSRVAIFRDREKDRRDPDYDRNTARFAHRFDPGFGISVGPYGTQALYSPSVNYNTEFPQLGVPSRGQLHMEGRPPQPLGQQHLRAPWVPSGNAIGYRASDSTMGPHHPTQMVPMAMYMRAPEYGYLGHAMNYMQPLDQIPQSQPHTQLQPDTSGHQARRR